VRPYRQRRIAVTASIIDDVGVGIASLRFHVRALYGPATQPEDLTPKQLAKAEARRVAAVRECREKGLRTRLLNKARRLRAEADAIEQMVAAELEARTQT
jgi:hypothetical protein